MRNFSRLWKFSVCLNFLCFVLPGDWPGVFVLVRGKGHTHQLRRRADTSLELARTAGRASCSYTNAKNGLNLGV